MKQDEIDVLARAYRDIEGMVGGSAYPPSRSSTPHERLRRKKLLRLDFGTTTYSIYVITDAGREAMRKSI